MILLSSVHAGMALITIVCSFGLIKFYPLTNSIE
jgi:hypothetical protein